MFGLGAMEIAVILLLALIVLGPEKLPEVARKMARFTGELRRVSDEVRRNFDEASRDMENLRRPVMEPPKPRPAPEQSIAQSAPEPPQSARNTEVPPASQADPAKAVYVPPPPIDPLKTSHAGHSPKSLSAEAQATVIGGPKPEDQGDA